MWGLEWLLSQDFWLEKKSLRDKRSGPGGAGDRAHSASRVPGNDAVMLGQVTFNGKSQLVSSLSLISFIRWYRKKKDTGMDLFGVQRGFLFLFLKKQTSLYSKDCGDTGLKICITVTFISSFWKIKGMGEEKKGVCCYFTFLMSLPAWNSIVFVDMVSQYCFWEG